MNRFRQHLFRYARHGILFSSLKDLYAVIYCKKGLALTTGLPSGQNGKKVKTFLIAFIDDASRTVTVYSFSFEENLSSVLSVFKTAVRRRGIPKKLYMDNGKVFRSDQLQFICASLGTIVSHTHPYDAAAKGKIERWFKTLKTQWLNLLDWSTISSLEQLNEMLSDYVENKYHQSIHSVIKAKPIDKFMEHIDRFRFVSSSQELDHIFLYRCVRKVRSDATISIMNIIFEVPMQYIGEHINVRYDPSSPDKAYIFDDDGNCLHTVYPVNRVDNSKIHRKSDVNPVDFSPFSDRQEV
jgi:putative transposase